MTHHPKLHPLIGTFVAVNHESEAVLARIDKVLVEDEEMVYKLCLMSKHGAYFHGIYFKFVGSAHIEREYAFLGPTAVWAHLPKPVLMNEKFFLNTRDLAIFMQYYDMYHVYCID